MWRIILAKVKKKKKKKSWKVEQTLKYKDF